MAGSSPLFQIRSQKRRTTAALSCSAAMAFSSRRARPHQQAGHPGLLHRTRMGRSRACARILDDLDQQLTSQVGTDKLHQLQNLLAEVTNVLRDSTCTSGQQ
jgi:hypothetical protein